MTKGFKPDSSKDIKIKTKQVRQYARASLAEELRETVRLHSLGILESPLDAYRNIYTAGLVDNTLYLNLALLEISSGNLSEARFILQKSISLDPNNFLGYLLLGTIMRRLDEQSLSVKYLQKSLDIKPDCFDAIVALSLSLFDCGRIDEALQACERAHKINPKSPELHANLSMIYLALGRVKDSKRSAKEAIKTNPNLPEAYLNLGNALHADGKWTEAIYNHQKALAIRPQFSQALCGVGNAHRALGNLDQAEKSFLKAIEINPHDYQSYSNLAITKRDQKELDSALYFCSKAISIKSDSAEILNNLGVIYYELGNFNLSEQAYRQAIDLEPDNAEAQFSLGVLQLIQGNYEQGLIQYEWRFAHNADNPIIQEIEGMMRWQGPVSDGIVPELYILHEQGLGDSIQFIRFAPLLKKYAKNVNYVGPLPLLDLFAASGVVDKVISLSAELGNYSQNSLSLPLMSIPHILGVKPSHFSSAVPYLKINKKHRSLWARKILLEKKKNDFSFLVALNWQGNPDVEKDKMKGRSIPLEMLSPLASMPGVRFVSIQKGYGSEQLAGCSFRDKFVHFQSEVECVWDFVDIASLIDCCDLVISSDTSAAHLAGAIGARLWMLLKKVPEWRWGAHDVNTPWYPTATLFRQTIDGDWSGPVELMRRALSREIMACH